MPGRSAVSKAGSGLGCRRERGEFPAKARAADLLCIGFAVALGGEMSAYYTFLECLCIAS